MISSKRSLQGIALALSFPCGLVLLSAAIHASPPPAEHVLDTSGEMAAENTAARLLADPQVKAVQRELMDELLKTSVAQAPGAKERLSGDLEAWTTSLIMRELAADPAQPEFLWTVDDTPHESHGISLPGRGVFGDNPDDIYRGTFIDGNGVYEIDGQLSNSSRPAQFTFEFTEDSPGSFRMKSQKRGGADIGNQIVMLQDRDMNIGADGRFRITVGGKGGGANHVAVPPGTVSINVRETLSDWSRQRPSRLTIRRLDRATTAPRDYAAVRSRLVADLPGYVRTWAIFGDSWFGKYPLNTMIGPMARDGGWGFAGEVHFRLQPDEALVIRTSRAGAKYTGIQMMDPWGVALDARKHFTSINTAQAVPDADGGLTYVVAPNDPGVANWVDVGGLGDGQIGLRWQGVEGKVQASDLIHSIEVVKLEQVADRTKLPRRSPEERANELAQRASEYDARSTW